MAQRNLLHRNKLEEFKKWLVDNNYTLLEPKGEWEVLRWVGEACEAMPIIYDRLSGDHLTVSTSGKKYVRRYIDQRKRRSKAEYEAKQK